MNLRYLKPETEQYFNLLAIQLHGNAKGNLRDTIEDIAEFLTKGKGEEDLKLYLSTGRQLVKSIAGPQNLDFLYVG